LEKRGRPANQITELNLDNCRSTNIVGLTDEYTALETLSLINVGLTSLKGFPKLPNLKKLELSDNRINNGLNNLHGSPKLTNLNLSGNKIKDLDELKALSEFKNLAVLDLFNNEVTAETEQYRETIFSMIPSLVYLDGYDINDVEVSDGEDAEDEDEMNGNDSDEDGNEASDVDGEDEGEDDGLEYEEEDDDDEEEAENGDVSLSAVYDDNLDEENSDEYVEEIEDEESDGEDEEDDDEGDRSAAPVAEADEADAAGAQADGDSEVADAPSPRGTKRKHDDEDNDG